MLHGTASLGQRVVVETLLVFLVYRYSLLKMNSLEWKALSFSTSIAFGVVGVIPL